MSWRSLPFNSCASVVGIVGVAQGDAFASGRQYFMAPLQVNRTPIVNVYFKGESVHSFMVFHVA